MNEYIAKKLGEVLAFSVVGFDNFERGKKALIEVLGSEQVASFIKELRSQKEQIEVVADQAGFLQLVLTKSQDTAGKIKSMRDLYVGDKWYDANELLEWLGFFEGAAIVHWNLIAGVANKDLSGLAANGLALHTNIFNQTAEVIRNYAQTKSG